MANNGAPPLSISLNGREFQCVGDSAGSPTQGGYTSEYLPNGDPNTGRYGMTPVPWTLPDQTIALDSDQSDWDFLNELRNSGSDIDVVVTYIDQIRGGTGRIVNDIPMDPMAASCPISISGSGKFKKQ